MYILGKILIDLEFQDAVLDVIMSGYHESGLFPHPMEITTIFEGTTENSPARALFVDFFCLQEQGLDFIQYNNYVHRVPADFNKHLLTVLLQKPIEINWWRPWIADRSAYFRGSRKETDEENEG
jgi:hypothetical protein